LSRVQCRVDIEDDNIEVITSFSRINLGLPKFDKLADNLKAFVNRFEVVFKAYRLPDSLKAVECAKCLSGPALCMYETLSTDSKLSYEEVIKAIKRLFGINIRSLQKRFLKAKYLENELWFTGNRP
jgi:hypothetical protein